MMKKSILLTIILIASLVQFTDGQNAGIVIYKHFSNGKEVTDEPQLKLEYKNGAARLTSIIEEKNKLADEEIWFDFANAKTYQTVLFKDGRRFTTVDSFASYPKPELTEETIAMVQGYMCRLATVTIRSNHIELWYTTDAGIKGTPGLNLGPELGLVLKVVRNGNYVIEADKVVVGDNANNGDDDSTSLSADITLPQDWGEMVDGPRYRQLVTENNYTTIRVFTDERINFGDTIVNPADDMENITYRYSNGNVLLKKIKLPENIYDNFLFAELVERSSGDAYDRTGSVFIIPAASKSSILGAFKNGLSALPVYKSKNGKNYQGIVTVGDYVTPTELMRFITPFGIGFYNQQVTVSGLKWEDSVIYKMDITDLLPVTQGEVWVGVFIGCYDKGGHTVSLNLQYHPFEIGQNVTSGPGMWIKPVINTVNLMETQGQEYGTVFLDDTLKAEVDIPSGLKELKLRCITTGHGGWDGGDEFNQKMNEIFIDGGRIANFIPWREDCSSYRKYNPATGNFPIGVSSSDFSRSGWCPGAAVNPVDIPIDLSKVKPGHHNIKVFIPMGKPEGTSQSAWNVSAIFIGEYNRK